MHEQASRMQRVVRKTFFMWEYWEGWEGWEDWEGWEYWERWGKLICPIGWKRWVVVVVNPSPPSILSIPIIIIPSSFPRSPSEQGADVVDVGVVGGEGDGVHAVAFEEGGEAVAVKGRLLGEGFTHSRGGGVHQ